jgi:hypothetical protein
MENGCTGRNDLLDSPCGFGRDSTLNLSAADATLDRHLTKHSWKIMLNPSLNLGYPPRLPISIIKQNHHYSLISPALSPNDLRLTCRTSRDTPCRKKRRCNSDKRYHDYIYSGRCTIGHNLFCNYIHLKYMFRKSCPDQRIPFTFLFETITFL